MDGEREQGPEGMELVEEDTGRQGLSRRQLLFRILGVFFVGLALLVAVYGVVAYAAWQRGQTLRIENAEKALADELEHQLSIAREDVRAGKFTLALRRVDWVLEQDPANAEAVALRQEAQTGLNVRLTPTVVPTPISSPTPTPEVEETIEPSEIASGFADLRNLMDAGEWKDAVSAIITFQANYPDYRRDETDSMLYEAYINLGLSLLETEQVELGLNYLEQAERLGNLPAEVEDQRTWAELYLLGIGTYGVNWETSLSYFRGLCAAAPFYQNSCGRLYQGLVAYGDQFAAAQDWCPAIGLYSEALRYDSQQTVSAKLQEARTNCLAATPTPGAVITDTVPSSDTVPSQ